MEIVWNQNGFEADLEYGKLKISGNEEAGFRPYQLLAASIAACSGTVLHNILEKKRIQLKDMTIETKKNAFPKRRAASKASIFTSY